MELPNLPNLLKFKYTEGPYSPKYKPVPPIPEADLGSNPVDIVSRPIEGTLTISEKKKINRTNFALAVGGKVFNNRGDTIEVEGIAERALKSIYRDLKAFDERTEFFQKEIAKIQPDYEPRRFLGLFKRPSIAREGAENTIEEYEDANQKLRKQIAQKREGISKLLSEHRIPGEVLGVWNDLIGITKFLRQNPQEEDFTAVQKQLDSLNINLPQRASDEGVSPRSYLELLISDTEITSPGFSDYVYLRLGSQPADKELDVLQEELDKRTVSQSEEAKQSYQPLAETKNKERLLAQDKTTLELSSKKGQEIVDDLEVIEVATEFIREHYLVDESEISAIDDETLRITDLKERLVASFAEAIQLSREVKKIRGSEQGRIRSKFEPDATPEMEKQLKKDVATLDKRLQQLKQRNVDIFDSKKRLTEAPAELKAALELVSRPNFNLDQMPRNQRRIILLDNKNSGQEIYITALVEMAVVLLGKGQIKSYEMNNSVDTVINEQTDSTELTNQAKIAPEKVVEAVIRGDVDAFQFIDMSSPTDNKDPIYLNSVNNVSYSPEQLADFLQTKADEEALSDKDTETYIYQLILTTSRDMYKAILFENNTIRSGSINLINQEELENLCRSLNMNISNMEIIMRLSQLILNLLGIAETIRLFGLKNLKY
ncbi:MAG: hypothetical protein Q8P92_04595 [Candidatus Daviesbacteria bacterium]|nr:hypothetical protein [Candidatus Daviesbacteria bacterium]